MDLVDLEDIPLASNALGTQSSSFAPSSLSFPQGRMNTDAGTGNYQSQPNESSTSVSAMVPSFLHGATHPYVCFFHLLFKSLSVFTYWAVYLFTKDIVITFILTTVFLAFDFWTVKNVTGRILVGLRWWNQVREDGTSEWMFECDKKREGQISSLDRSVFWIALYVFPVYWTIAAISNILSFSPNFVVLNVMGLAFAGTNALGYSKCSRSGQVAVRDWATGQAMSALTSATKAGIFQTGSSARPTTSTEV